MPPASDSFRSGETIIRQGDIADNFYIISKGEVVVQRTDEEGHATEIGRLGKGSYFGEIGLLHGGRRTANVSAAGSGSLERTSTSWLQRARL